MGTGLQLQLNIAAAWICCCLMGMCIKAADMSIQVGDIGSASVNTTKALGLMSGLTTDKGIWWQLGSSTIHPEAFLRFLLLGASNAGVLPNASWGHTEEDLISSKSGGLLATRDAAIAEFSSHQQNKELGNVVITAWMLGFHCLGDSESGPCTSIAPVAIVNRVDETSKSTCPEFTTVWDKLVPGKNVVANSITANLVNVSKEEKTIEQAEGELDKFSLRVSMGLEPCPIPSMVAMRSSLDATYNLGPYACHQIRQGGTTYLLVLGMQGFNSSSEPIVDGKGPIAYDDAGTTGDFSSSTQCIKLWLHNYSQTVQLGKCQDAPLLAYLANDDVFVACLNSSSATCLELIDDETSSCNESMGKLRTAFESTANYSQGFKARNVSAFNYIMWGSSNYGLPAGNLCEAAAGINTSNLVQSGKNYNNDPVAVDADTLGLLFTGLNNRYAQAHSDAFQLERGPSTDFLTATIALIGAAISVLTAIVPFTNFLLRLLIKAFGSLPKSSSCRHRDLVLLSLVNVVVVALVSYAAVLGVIMSETQREQEFSSWALITETVLVNPMGLQLQTLYVVQGNSVYKSKLLMLIWILVSIVLVLVGGLTYRRCRDVLNKLRVIKEKASSAVALVDDYKAIEMGTAEYMELLHHQPGADADAAILMSPATHEAEDSLDPVQLATAHDLIEAKKGRFRVAAYAVIGLHAIIKNASKQE